MKRHRLIIASLGMITATTIASIAMTVAWYASGNLLGIDQIEITFRGEKNILAGFDPEDVENFKDTIVFNDEVEDKIYNPVSSMFSDEWLTIESDRPVFRTGYTSVTHDDINSYTKSTTLDVEDGYFSKEIYLYCDSNVIITLDGEGTSFYPDSNANAATANELGASEEERTAIKDDLDNVVNSLRFSVLIPQEDEYAYYIVDPKKENDTYLCGSLNLNEGVSEYYHTYYKDGEEFETFFGEYNDESLLVYNPAETSDSGLDGRATEFNAKHKKGVRTVNLEESIENGFEPKVEQSLTLKEADITTAEGQESGIRIKLKAYEPKKIVLSMYLEGWDRDNVGYTKKGQFYADIKFQIGEENY